MGGGEGISNRYLEWGSLPSFSFLIYFYFYDSAFCSFLGLCVSSISETCSLARVFDILQWMMDYVGYTEPCQRLKSVFSIP
jgi:hypothetical protein